MQDIPSFPGPPDSWGIAINCRVCKDLEEICESKLTEYIEACSAAYYKVSTELAAYKNVEMERAKSELEEHRFVCVCTSESSQAGPTSMKPEGM